MRRDLIEPFFATLQAANPEPKTELEYSTPFELLAAVLLSAQATDVGVTKATRVLYPVANTPRRSWHWVSATGGLPQDHRPVPHQAKNLMETCRLLIEAGGEVPRTHEEREPCPAWVARRPRGVERVFGQPPWRWIRTSSAWATVLAWRAASAA